MALGTLAEHPRLPSWLSSKESTRQCRRCEFDPWVGKILWRRKWQPTPVFLPGKSMDKGAWLPVVHGVTRVVHDLATKPPSPGHPQTLVATEASQESDRNMDSGSGLLSIYWCPCVLGQGLQLLCQVSCDCHKKLYNLGGLKQQWCILLQFRRPEVWNPGVDRVFWSILEALKENHMFPVCLLVSGGGQQSLGPLFCRCLALLSICIFSQPLLCISVCPLLILLPVVAFRATLTQYAVTSTLF